MNITLNVENAFGKVIHAVEHIKSLKELATVTENLYDNLLKGKQFTIHLLFN